MPKKHTAQAGESVESIAFDNGFFWETVWNYGANSALRAAREPNILEEGDVVEVPDKRPKTLSEPVDQRYRYRRKGVPIRSSRSPFLDQNKPRPNVPYTVTVGEKVISGTTDADGWVRCYLMPDVETGVLRLPETDESPTVSASALFGPSFPLRGCRTDCTTWAIFKASRMACKLPNSRRPCAPFSLPAVCRKRERSTPQQSRP